MGFSIDNRLAEMLEEWFERTGGRVSRWTSNPVGRVIKKRLRAEGHWKNLARGDALKGGMARKRQLEAGGGW